MNTIFGLKVIVTQDHPKMQLSDRVKEVLTPEMIADHNAWMREFFGASNLCKDGAYIIMEYGNSVLMNPRTLARIQEATCG